MKPLDRSQESPRSLPTSVPAKFEQFVAGYIRGKFAEVLAFLIFFLPLFGPALIVIQMEEGIPYINSGPDPQAISCRELLANGPGQNWFVDLTDFRLELDRLASADSVQAMKRAWIPVVEASSAQQPQPVRILLDTESVRTRNDIKQLEQSNRIRGLLHHDKEYLELGDSIYVGRKYPNTDWKHTWVLQHEKIPPNRWATYLIVGLGVFLILIAVPYWWFAWRIWRVVNARLMMAKAAGRVI